MELEEALKLIDEQKASMATMLEENKGMSTKLTELLDETKAAKKARKEADDAATKAKDDAAHKAGDFESLLNSSKEEHEATKTELQKLRDGIGTEKVTTEATKLAATLAEGENVSLLSSFIERRLRYDEGAVKVTDPDGKLTVSTLDDLSTQFSNDKRYASLLKGNQSSGGGAGGGGGGSATRKTMTRAEFDSSSPSTRMEFSKSGGQVTDA